MNFWRESSTIAKIIMILAGASLVVACFVGSIFMWSIVLAPQPEPTPAPPEADESWSRIQAAGKIRVGTAADYPPFEYYTAEFQIDGFDVALMREIGQKLGVEVEFRDFTFDGLGGALELDQIDVAIAALSITPEREAFVDFSNVYFVSEDAILAHGDSTISSVGSVDEMASRPVGVQRGSVHERWLQTSLVDTGKMPVTNLLSFVKIDEAVADLKAQRVELVALDALPAESFEDQGGVKIVGQGLNQQRYGIAVRKGAASLKSEIDRALTELNNEGRIAQLAQQYLGLAPEQLPPTPTPTPGPAVTATPGPPAACVDGMALVEHLTHDDKNMLAPPKLPPGQSFVKGWRVRNAGTCKWDSSYRLVYAYGNVPEARMGGEPVVIAREVLPNDTYDIQVNLVAPLRPGTYRGFWQMQNGQGATFGEMIWVGIEVPAPDTLTPVPTQTPSPGISFTADRTKIKAGERVIFTWDVRGGKAVYFYAEGERWQDSGVVGQGSREVYPLWTTTYNLRVVHLDDRVEIRQIRIEVEPVEGAPEIYRFTVDPAYQITLGQCVQVRWRVEGSVDTVTLTANGTILWASAPTRGRLEDCPSRAGTVAYMLEAVGPGGTSRQQQMINVVPPATATPQPTPSPGLPVIHAFSVSPNQIEVGDCVGVAWSVGGDADRVQIRLNGQVALDNAGFKGNEQHCPDDSGSYVYRVEAYNAANDMVHREETVSVTEGAPDNPLAGTSWRATAYFDGTGMTSVLAGTTPTAAFGAGGDLNGSAGCNSYGGNYLVDGNTLTVGALMSTQILCGEPEGIMEQESAFLAALQSASSFNLEGGQLFIQDGSGRTSLEFVTY